MVANLPLITICGLGPGGRDRITEETAALLGGAERVFLRTARHPSADRAPGAASFDELYESADSFDEVYRSIADSVLNVARADGDVVYAVPGSPLVLERSVRHLRAARGVDVRLLPAVSFLDEVWAELAVDPVDDGVRLIDGLQFGTRAADQVGPLLVAHAHSPWVLSDIKLSVDVGPEQKVVVLQRLGTDQQRIFEVEWPDLDRLIEPDHLTTLYIPEMAAPVGFELARSVEMMRRLRRDCPWDREQDHASLRKYLIEEAYEVLDALDNLASSDGYADLEEELGDLWFQILFHAELASEAGQFTIADVARSLSDKMIARHPHVYDNRPVDADSLVENWEVLKQQEKQRGSVLDGIPSSLPALALAEKLLKKAERAGATPLLHEAEHQVSALVGEATTDEQVGATLLAFVELTRRRGINPETALREATKRAERRFRAAEASGQPDDRWVVG